MKYLSCTISEEEFDQYFTLIKKERDACEVLSNWARLKSHDRCWHHPDILVKLCEIFEVQLTDDLPPKEEFDQECKKYSNSLYSMVDTFSAGLLS